MKHVAIKLASVVIGLSLMTPATLWSGEKESDKGWIKLFNGKNFTGWKMSETDHAKWKVEDGKIVANGPRSHLFTEREFKNFEFKAEAMTTPGSNSGIYFHTKYQEEGWPMHGYECQVNVTHRDPVKSGSLYGVVKRYETPAEDNEWATYYIKVQGKRILIKVNGKTMVDYTEPDDVEGPRRLSQGSFALQAHDPNSVVYYRNIRVRPLDE